MNSDKNETGHGFRSRRAAFTMVEVMIVLGAIGLLVAIAVPSYKKARTDALRKKAEAEVQMLATAIRQLMWDTHYVPNGYEMIADHTDTSKPVNNDEVSDLSVAAAGLAAATSSYVGWKGPYLRKVERDPWGSRYFFDPDYTISGAIHRVVGSFGPNRSVMNQYDSDNIYVILD